MATKLADQTYNEDFDGGQGGGASNYFTYAADLDTNFVAIRGTVDSLVDEINALQGPNALLPTDMLTSTSPAVSAGIMGVHSFDASFPNTTTIRLQAGSALTAGSGRVAISTTTDLVGSGPADTFWVALNANGTISLETAAGQQALDLWTLDWDGAIWTQATLTRLTSVLFDGDDYQDSLTVVGNANAGPPTQTHTKLADRLENVERIIRGVATNIVSGATALGPMAFSGTVGAPGLVPTNGTVWDTTSGFFRAALDQIGVSIEGFEALRWDLSTAGEPQTLFQQGTNLAAPPVSWFGDLDTGLGYVTTDEFRAVAGGRAVMSFLELASIAQAALAKDGTNAAPSLAFLADLDTGLYSPGDNRLAATTAGNQCMEFDPQGNLDLALNSRVRTFQDAFTITQTSLTNIDFDNESYDVGTWHDNVTNPDRHTVPTGGDGTYQINGHVIFDESTAASGGAANAGNFRAVQIEINGSAVNLAGARVAPLSSGDLELVVSDTVALAAGDIVRLQAAHDNGGDMDVDSELSVAKVA